MKKSTLLIIVAIVLVGALAYFYLKGGEASNDAALQVQENPEVQASAARVLSLLNQIRSLHIDTALFDSPEYQTLRDYTVVIPPVEVGRLNPFAPFVTPATPRPSTSPRPTTQRR